MPRLINYVMERPGWVQHQRVEHLRRHQSDFAFRVMTFRRFAFLWRLGLLRRQRVLFTSWRMVHGALKANPGFFKDRHFCWFLGAVTSHTNIGGGLDPTNPVPGRTPEEAYRLAVRLLGRFKVVTVNSLILKDLLAPALPHVLYCPNGVDADFFRPDRRRPYDHDRIRIGWVGKQRGAKNFPAIKEALERLETEGGFETRVIKVDKAFKRPPYTAEQMRNFYRDIDYYLCASWNEGTPNPALEAASCGVPVVTTRVGNMPELIRPGENGWFIEPTVASIVGRFRQVRSLDIDRYGAMSANMRKAIERHWPWEARTGNFVEAFRALVS